MARYANVRGVNESKRAFRELARLVTGPARTACKRSLEPMLAQAKENVRVRSGRYRDALAIILDSKSPKTAPRYHLGPNKEAKVHYGHLDEWGRAPSDGHPGYSGSRALTRAFESCREGAVKIFSDTLLPALDAQAKKLAAKVKK